MAVPPFFTGVLLTLIFGLMLRWFTPGAFVAPEVSFWRSVGYLMFPAVSIALPRIAMTVKMLKGSILTELERDYVRTSYSRGNSRRTTLYRHVLRNAVPATVTFLAMTGSPTSWPAPSSSSRSLPSPASGGSCSAPSAGATIPSSRRSS